ncbi:MAG: BON domain-containing protein [Pseudomonadota bacterium]
MINTSLYASTTDDRIESSAKQTYVFKTYLKDENIAMSSKDGNVTLTGTVSEEQYLSLAKDTVAGLPGVKSVDNQLTVAADAPLAGSDAWLITKVKFTLLINKNVNVGTNVTAENGVVTLRGEAANMAQKDLTTAYAADVEGVTSVINEMTVSAEVSQEKSKTAVKMEAISESVDDASITALVKGTLLCHRSTSALRTNVQTNGGVVTLSGEAKSDAEKDLAAKLVSDVHGVKKVVNNITVI